MSLFFFWMKGGKGEVCVCVCVFFLLLRRCRPMDPRLPGWRKRRCMCRVRARADGRCGVRRGGGDVLCGVGLRFRLA